MSVFCLKKIKAPIRLHEELKCARQKSGASLELLEEKTHIPIKYLSALESGHYTELPKAKAYRLAYVREYAIALNLNPETTIYKFTQENGLDDVSQIHPHRSIKTFPFSSVALLLRNLLIAVLVLIFAIYLIWQIKGIVTPPNLTIYTPLEGSLSSRPIAIIQGVTEKECRININGQDIMADEQGNFTTLINLSTGVNTITISATKKHGKTTTEIRHVIVQGGGGI